MFLFIFDLLFYFFKLNSDYRTNYSYYKVEDYAKSFTSFSKNWFGDYERKRIAKRDQPCK